MVNSYKLVNPYIKGDFETKVKSKNSLEAAKKFYNALSEHFNNSVPKFYFTIQKGGSNKGKFFHFEVNEDRKSDEVNFSIKPFNIDGEESAVRGFIDNFKEFKGRFKGGAKRRSKRRSSKRRSSKRRSSKRRSSNNLDIDLNPHDDSYATALRLVSTTSQPISYLYYDPLIYRLPSVFIPTFYAYLSPYVEINTRDGMTVTYPSIASKKIK